MFLVYFPHGLFDLEYRNLDKAIKKAEELGGTLEFKGVEIESGEQDTEGYDTGVMEGLDGSCALVRWESGIVTYVYTSNINAIA